MATQTSKTQAAAVPSRPSPQRGKGARQDAQEGVGSPSKTCVNCHTKMGNATKQCPACGKQMGAM